MKFIAFDIENGRIINTEVYDDENNIMVSIMDKNKDRLEIKMSFENFDFEFDYLLRISDNFYNKVLKMGLSKKEENNFLYFLEKNNFYEHLI